MDDFISNFFPNLKEYFIISEGKNRKKQQWILTKEYFQPFETLEDGHSFILVESSDQEFYLRLKCAYNAAKTGIKEGLLTGFFFGGFWGLLKELNDFDFGFFEKINSPKEDEINRRLANRSYAVLKSFEYAQKYTSAAEPISIISSLSKNTILTESLKSYHNISPLDLIMRNSVKTSSEGRYGGGETKSVKNLFQHSSEYFSKTNHILESLYPKVPDFYDGNPFGFRKGREKVEIVGCALIQTTGSLGSIKSRSSSDTSDELPKKRSEELEPPQPIPSKSEKSMINTDNQELQGVKSKGFQSTENIKMEPKISVPLNRNMSQRKSTNIKFDNGITRLRGSSKDKKRKSSLKSDAPLSKLKHSGSYKTTLLDNLPENNDFNDIDQPADNENKYEERSRYRKSSTYRPSRGSILLPPDFLEKYGRSSKDHRVESYKKKLHYLVNIDELSNGYSSDDTPPPTVASFRVRRPLTEPSDTSLFLEEIKKLKEALLDEPPYQSSGEITPESSHLSSKKYILSEKPSESVKTYDSDNKSAKASKIKITPSSHEIGLIKSFFHKRKPLALEKESKPEVPPRQRKPSTMSIFPSSEVEIVPAPRRKISSITSSVQSSREFTQAPKQTSSVAPTTSNKESRVTPETRETQPSVAPVVLSQIPQAVPAPRKIRQTAPMQREIQPSVAPTHRQTQPSSAPSLQSQVLQATPTPRQRQPPVNLSPRQTQPLFVPNIASQTSEAAPSSSQTQPSVTPAVITHIPQAVPTPRQTAPHPEEAQPSTAPTPSQTGKVSGEAQPPIAPVAIQTQPSSAPTLQGHIPQTIPTPRQRQTSITASPRQKQPSVTSTPISQAPEAISTPRKRQPSITETSGGAQPYIIPSVLSQTPQATPAPRKRRSSLVPTSQTHQPTIAPFPLNHPPESIPIPKQRQTSIIEQTQTPAAPTVPIPTRILEVAPSPKQRKLSGGVSQILEVAPATKQTAFSIGPAPEEAQTPLPPAVQIPQATPQTPKPTQPPVAPTPLSKEPKVTPVPSEEQPSPTPIVQSPKSQAPPALRQTAPSTAPKVETKSSVYPPPLPHAPDVPEPRQTKPSTAPSTGITQPIVSIIIPGQEPDSVSAPKPKKPSIAPTQGFRVAPGGKQTQASVSLQLPHQKIDDASAPRQPKPSIAQPTEVTPTSRLTKTSIFIPPYGQESEGVPKPRTAKPSIGISAPSQVPEMAPVPKPRKPSTAPALQTQGPKIVSALKSARPSGTENSESELKKKPQKRVSLAPERNTICSQLFSSVNENLMFINACNCALVVGIICCGLSALRASCLVINQ